MIYGWYLVWFWGGCFFKLYNLSPFTLELLVLNQDPYLKAKDLPVHSP